MPVMQTWNTSYERVGWTRQAPVHLVFVAACMLVFVVSAVRFVVTRHRWREGRAARSLGLAVALANVIFVVWLLASIRSLGSTTPLPARDVALLHSASPPRAVRRCCPASPSPPGAKDGGRAAAGWPSRCLPCRPSRSPHGSITGKLLGFRY
jgi:hypothetical protein